MVTAQGFVPGEGAFYFAAQSAKGTAATTFKGGLGVTAIDWEPVINTIKGVPFVGAGYWRQQQIGIGILVNWKASGWGTLDQLPSFLFAGLGVKGTTTTLATTGFSTPFTMNNKNTGKKYLTLAYLVGESTAGTGIIKSVLRDAVIATVTYNIVNNQAFTWEASGLAINEGPGASSSYSFNSNFNQPNITNNLNALTYPSFVPAAFFTTSLVVTYSSDLTAGPNGIGTVEPVDIYIDNANWKVVGKAQGDTNFTTFYDHVNYKTASPTADSSQMSAALKSGAFNILINSDTIIPSSSPPTNYSLNFSFPSMQYTKAKFSEGTPVMGEFEVDSFSNDATITVGNATSSAGMVI